MLQVKSEVNLDIVAISGLNALQKPEAKDEVKFLLCQLVPHTIPE
jgi:hypothetical protein